MHVCMCASIEVIGDFVLHGYFIGYVFRQVIHFESEK